MVQSGNTNTIDLGNARVDVSSGGAHAVLQSGSTWAYGSWPQSQTLNGSASQAATTTDNTQIYENTDSRAYGYHLIENTSSTDGVTVQVSVDGSNYSGDVAVKLHDATAETTHVVSIPAGDFGVLTGKFYSIRVLKDGTTNEAPSCRYLHGNL